MNKLKAAFYTFYKSLISPRYYKDLLEVDFGFSIKYFLVLAFVTFMITTPSIFSPLKNDFNNALNTFIESSTEYFPKDLIIEIKEGQISINKPEPYILPIPEDYQREDIPNNLIVIDTDGTINDLDNYNTFSLINKTNILMKESNKVKVFPLRDIPDTKITHEKFVNTLDTIKPYLKALPYVLIGFALIIGGLIYFGSRIIYLLLVAFVFWIFAKLVKIAGDSELNFKKSYQIAIHSMTLPLIIETIADVAQIPINAPFWFLAVNLTFGMTAIYYIAKDKADKEY